MTKNEWPGPDCFYCRYRRKGIWICNHPKTRGKDLPIFGEDSATKPDWCPLLGTTVEMIRQEART